MVVTLYQDQTRADVTIFLQQEAEEVLPDAGAFDEETSVSLLSFSV